MNQLSERDTVSEKWFHISTKGIDRNLFISSQDYNKILNIIAICSIRYGIRVIAYCIMTNHIHLAVQAMAGFSPNLFINLIKQNYSRYFKRIYGISQIFDKVPVSVNELKTQRYLKNCIAYILRNPVEARICSNADQYMWSSYNCYFNSGADVSKARKIADVSKRELKRLLASHEDLHSSALLLSESGNILPESFVEAAFVENLFGNSRDELAKSIAVNPYLALEYELANPVRLSLPHYELVRVASEEASRKFSKKLSALTLDERAALVLKLNSDYYAGSYEICQILSLSRKTVNRILGLPPE